MISSKLAHPHRDSSYKCVSKIGKGAYPKDRSLAWSKAAMVVPAYACPARVLLHYVSQFIVIHG